MREGVLVLDEEGRILLVNPALRATLGIPADTEGRAALELIRNAELPSILERARAASGPITGEIETTGPRPRRLLVHAAPLPMVDGKHQGLLAVFVDVTEMRRLETLRKDFVANVSHELRTPITAVRSAVETLRLDAGRRSGGVRTLRRHHRPQRAAPRLAGRGPARSVAHRIEGLPARGEAGAAAHRRRPGADAAARAHRGEDAGGRQRDRRRRCRRLAPIAARSSRCSPTCSTTRCKYCPAGARVSLRAQQTERGLRVEIADTGPGIEPRHLPRLFERFYRVDSGRSRDMGGTGLGLSIVKHLVETMGGAIGVESTPGRGSTFWFTLPAMT